MTELFSPKTLKHFAMRKIIAAHSCFNELNNASLRLPKRLFSELVDVGPKMIEMPEYDEWNINFWNFEDSDKLHTTLKYNKTYSKYYVVWVQNEKNLERYLPVVTHFIRIYFVIFHGIFHGTEHDFLLCFKCFKLHLNSTGINLDYCTVYKHSEHNVYVLGNAAKNVIQDKKNWCNYCRQTPLFQVADYNMCETLFGSRAHDCPGHAYLQTINDLEQPWVYCANCFGSGTRRHFCHREIIDKSLL